MNGTEVVNSTGDAAFAVDREGRILAWNRAAVNCLGYRRSEIVGRACWEILQGRDQFSNRYCGETCPLRSMAVRGEPIHRCQMVFRAAGGEELAVRVSVLVVRGETGPEIVHLFHCPSGSDVNVSPLGPANPGRNENRLSRRQQEVLSHLSDGRGIQEISELLGISPATARHHVQNILARLKVHSRLEAVSLAGRIGLI